MTIYQDIENLIQYGLQKGLISVWDIDYVQNGLFQLFELDGEECEKTLNNNDQIDTPVVILENMLAYAFDQGLIEDNTVTERDLFDPKIMDQLMPKPAEVIRTFYQKYQENGEIAATDYFYKLSQDIHYIRTDRIAKNMHWYSETDYGDLEITINLSKPEKDPKAIAASKANVNATYPKCLLCKENVGYSGRLDHPARDNHRIIPIELEGEYWFLQYSPYVYYNEHAIILSREHRPMTITKQGFDRLLHFTEQLPHYFVGSNADLPIVGGSILSHDHFQAGHHEFPMAKAPIQDEFSIKGFSDVSAGIVQWPMSVIRLVSNDRKRLSELGDLILQSWRQYSDEQAEIYAESAGELHNTITPIARFRDGRYELDLVLRNNRTDHQHPMGIFHPHEEVHHIKKENIGLIEVMGLAVLPGRLVEEMEVLAEYVIQDELETKALEDERTSKHVKWAETVIIKYDLITEDHVMDIFKKEIGKTFSTVLEHAGVFKRTKSGNKAFQHFINQIG